MKHSGASLDSRHAGRYATGNEPGRGNEPGEMNRDAVSTSLPHRLSPVSDGLQSGSRNRKGRSELYLPPSGDHLKEALPIHGPTAAPLHPTTTHRQTDTHCSRSAPAPPRRTAASPLRQQNPAKIILGRFFEIRNPLPIHHFPTKPTPLVASFCAK